MAEFKVTKTSSFKFQRTVKLKTVEDLIQWCRETGNEVIITGEDYHELEIYDDSCREKRF